MWSGKKSKRFIAKSTTRRVLFPFGSRVLKTVSNQEMLLRSSHPSTKWVWVLGLNINDTILWMPQAHCVRSSAGTCHRSNRVSGQKLSLGRFDALVRVPHQISLTTHKITSFPKSLGIVRSIFKQKSFHVVEIVRFHIRSVWFWLVLFCWSCNCSCRMYGLIHKYCPNSIYSKW